MSIRQEVVIETAPARIYQVLMSTEQFAEFTSAAAKISPVEGGEFHCFDGVISGRQVELRENQLIIQAWRVEHWPAGVYSIVRISLEEFEGEWTRLTLDHTGFPPGTAEHLEPGWHKMYWEPLKAYLE